MSIDGTLGTCKRCGWERLLFADLCDECWGPEFAEAALADVEEALPWRSLSDIAREEVDWLWYPRVAMGKMTIVAGDPGLGKSMFTMALGARVSMGQALPDSAGPTKSGVVVLASYEDGPGDTIRPRMEQQGADLAQVKILNNLKDEFGRPRPFQASDIPLLDEVLGRNPQARLMVIDPLSAFVGARTDVYRDNEVRGALQPLVDMAERRRIALVCVCHLNKSDVEKVLYKVSGSIGFAARARSVLLVGKDPDSQQRGIAHIKSNLSPLADGLEFFIDQGGFRWGQRNPHLTAERLLKPPDARKNRDERDGAIAFLETYLRDGPQLSKEVQEAAEEQGITKPTLRRAKDEAGVKAYRGKEKDAPWYWRLP